jgi:hypothetical protein
MCDQVDHWIICVAGIGVSTSPRTPVGGPPSRIPPYIGYFGGV